MIKHLALMLCAVLPAAALADTIIPLYPEGAVEALRVPKAVT